MSLVRSQQILLLIGFASGALCFRQTFAQSATNPPATLGTDSALQAAAHPSEKPPVTFFRELLAMKPAERQQAIANRSLEKQQAILAKVTEYEALPPDERELRLRATELHWYLVPLLSAPPGGNAAALSRIPTDMRKLVEDRLEQWQILPPPIKEQILADDDKLELYLQLTGITTPQQENLSALYPPGLREQIEAEIQKVSPFFDLTPEEKAKVLAKLSESERREMEATLRIFEKLPREQRAQCVTAFGKFSSLSTEGQQQFFKNAERWQAMTPAERQQWRDLVRQVPQWPPLPPGMELSPMPQRMAPGTTTPVATNRNATH